MRLNLGLHLLNGLSSYYDLLIRLLSLSLELVKLDIVNGMNRLSVLLRELNLILHLVKGFSKELLGQHRLYVTDFCLA